jgi:hypothetical protein
MATINLGAIKFKWQGAYNAGTAYTVDDVVSYNGSSYICILASTGNLPTNATYWEQMSSAGTNGTDGTDLTTTLTTQGDILYRDGSGLQRLGAGTAGQVLQTGGAGANVSWTDVSAGITEADTWRITASHSVGLTETTVTNNWERNDTSFSVLGTGMTEVSGVFIFPSTGIWYVSFHGMMTGNVVDYAGAKIDVSTDGGSNYNTRSEAYQNARATASYVSPTSNIMIDVDNVSNVRVRFRVIANDALDLQGSTNANYTWANFIRLGDR